MTTTLPSPYYTNYTKTQTWFHAALIVVALDGILTTVALNTIPGASEANPIIAAAIGWMGVEAAMLLKILIGSFIAVFLAHSALHGYPHDWLNRNWRFQKTSAARGAVRAVRILAFLTVAHSLIVVNNLIVIGRYS